ncbi:hypothetical protein FRC18_000491 [Serendipita sp. 400]|nr:hypothetical protein FRC18_000491 [Serendipita sp. 400]
MPIPLNEDILLEIYKWFVSVDENGPFTIFFLSTKWRDILLRTPALWSWITIDSRLPDLAERVHTCLEMTKGLPIYLTLKWPITDLSPFTTVLQRARLLVVEVWDEPDIRRVVFPLFINHQFPNIRHVMYIRRADGEERFADIDMLTVHHWGINDGALSTSESILKAIKALPYKAVTGFNFGFEPGPYRHTQRALEGLAIDIMRCFTYLRHLTLRGSTVLRAIGQIQEAHIVNLPNLRVLHYTATDSRLDQTIRPKLTICAPALEKIYVGNSLLSVADMCLRLGLKADPLECTFTLSDAESFSDESSVDPYAKYHRWVTILDVRLPITESSPSAVSKSQISALAFRQSLHSLAAQMPQLWKVRIQVSHHSMNKLVHLLPFPQLDSRPLLSYHIEISGMHSPKILHSLVGIKADRLALDIASQTKDVPLQARHLLIGAVTSMDTLITTICSFRSCLESLDIGPVTQRTVELSRQLDVWPLPNLTMLRTNPRIALTLLQLHILPALKTLCLTREFYGYFDFYGEVLEELQDYYEVTLEALEFLTFPSWPSLCRFINTRYSNSGSVTNGDTRTSPSLTLKFPASPCPLVLHSLAMAFRGEYLYSPGPICEDHRHETGTMGHDIVTATTFSLTSEGAFEYYLRSNVD